MPSKIDNDGATGWYADGVHRYNDKTWGMSGKTKSWPAEGEPFSELQKVVPERYKGKQLAVGNPAEVRRFVNGDTKEGAALLERLDRIHGCFDRVRYTSQEFGGGAATFSKDPVQQEYRAKYNSNNAFGSKDWSKRDEYTDSIRVKQFTIRLETEIKEGAKALQSTLARSGGAILSGSASAPSSPTSPGGASSPERGSPSPTRSLRAYAHSHTFDQIRDVRDSKDIYATSRMGKASHVMTLGSMATSNSMADEDVKGAVLATPSGAHFNACQEFFRVTSGSPQGLQESTMLPRQII